MCKSRYTDSRIMAILKQNEHGASVKDICWRHGLSSAQTIFDENGAVSAISAALQRTKNHAVTAQSNIAV